MSMGIAWVIVMVASIVIECLTLGLVTTWFAFGALIAFISYCLGASQLLQILIFLIASIILLIFTRPIAMKYLKIGRTKTNIDSIIGEKAKVTQKISNFNNQGKAVYKGQEWTARSTSDENEIEECTIVVIDRIEGVKLIVKEIK